MAFSAPVDCEPLEDLLPVQSPDAEHALALFAVHERVAAPPVLIAVGLALKVMTGACAATVTVAVWVAVPPAPVQVMSYSVVLESAPVDHVPLTASAPLQPPEAAHAVAFCEFQLRLDAPPAATVGGNVVMVTVGAAEITTTSAD